MTTINTTASRSKHAPAGWNFFQTFRGAVMQITERIQRMRNAHATYTALRDLDDHMLRDIGLTRSDIVDLQNFGRDR